MPRGESDDRRRRIGSAGPAGSRAVVPVPVPGELRVRGRRVECPCAASCALALDRTDQMPPAPCSCVDPIRTHCWYVEFGADASQPAKNLRRDGGRGPGIVGEGCENVCVTESPSAAAHRLLAQAVDALTAVAESGSDAELVSLLTVCEGAARRLDRVTVDAVAALERRGTFSERGYKSPPARLSDLLGWERFEARRRVTAAEQVTPRVGLDGVGTAGATARDRAGLRDGSGEPAARRGRRPRARQQGGRAALPAAVGGRRGAARGEDRLSTPRRELHELGHGAGRGARPGRR